MFSKRAKKDKVEVLSEFRQNILKSNFEVAYELAKNMSMEDIFNDLYAIADPVDNTGVSYNLLPYAFIESVLLKKETLEYHMLAVGLMIMPYNVFQGAAEIALWHSRMALKFDQHCIDALKAIVHLYEHEETSATEEEYQKALKVLQE